MAIINNEFNIYKRGSFVGKVKFGETQILISEKNMETSTMGNYKAISSNMSHSYDFPFEKFFSNIHYYEKTDWKDKIVYINDLEYECFMALEDGEKKSRVWAQINNPAHDYLLIDVVLNDNSIIALMTYGKYGWEILCKEGYENATPLKLYENKNISSCGKGIKKNGSYMIPMRDGIMLSTDVYLPAEYDGVSELPTVLVRTCYGKDDFAVEDRLFCDRGYAYVAQDVRGTGDSEGEFICNINERFDGSDTLNWVAQQSWSNGKIGTIGGSYGGYVQWAMAASGNPNLSAIISICTAGTPFVDIERRGGAYNMQQVRWYTALADKLVDFDVYKNVDWNEAVKIRPFSKIVEKISGKKNPSWEMIFDNPDYNEVWKKQNHLECLDDINVPALYLDGWYDADLLGAQEMWEANKKKGSDNQKLILGPWTHWINNNRTMEAYRFSPEAVRYDIDVLCIEWFDKFLKGIDNGVEKNKVEYYLVGENKWKIASDWPPRESKFITYYLNGQEEMKLTQQIPNEQGFCQYDYNPNNPTPSIFDPLTIIEYCNPADYSDIEKRTDVIVFTSESMESDVNLTGNAYVTLFASSSAKDTDWVARLTVVNENGASLRLSDEIIRAKYRNGFEKQELLVPNEIVEYNIKLPYFAHKILKGQKLRLQICSSMNGLYFPNSNTGNDPKFDRDLIIATQKIYYGSRFTSKIDIQVLK